MSIREPTVAALFVDPLGVYWNDERCWCWGEEQDARNYAGPLPVVAHPPCNLWVNLAALNWFRYGRQRPAWYAGGTDGGCFRSALSSVLRWGGVLEHPASTHAWSHHGLPRPRFGDWTLCWSRQTWVTEVWQSTYGHPARKRTWLLYCGGRPPFELRWERKSGTHQVGWFDRAKPTVSKRIASATPVEFADTLIRLASSSRSETRQPHLVEATP